MATSLRKLSGLHFNVHASELDVSGGERLAAGILSTASPTYTTKVCFPLLEWADDTIDTYQSSYSSLAWSSYHYGGL